MYGNPPYAPHRFVLVDSAPYRRSSPRQACIQEYIRCHNCGSIEYSLRWCSVPFQNVFSLLSPALAEHDPDGSVFETWRRGMRNWRCKGPQHRHQDFVRCNVSGNGPSRPHNIRSHLAHQGNDAGATPASSADAP